MLKKNKYKESTNFLLETSKLACQEIMKIYSTDFSFNLKNDNSPVTLADIESNKIILDRLQKKFPNIPVVSEESTRNNGNLKNEFFLVDPLDGTKEFIKKNGEFTVNIAYILDYTPIISVLSIPALDKHYFTDGKESFVLNKNSQMRIFSKKSTIPRILISRSHLDAHTKKIINKFDKSIIKKKGSSLKFCLIAEGKADLYFRFGKTKEWDIAAGHAILRNANGLVTDLNMNEIKYAKKNLENPPFLAYSNYSEDFLKYVYENI